MTSPSISIIIPMYNTQLYIASCIESIITQDILLNIECIIIDDCSTDNSYQVAFEALSKSNKKNINFHLIRNQMNKGVSYSRNKGLELSKGKYIFFMDSDDLLPTNALSTLYEGFTDENIIIVSGMVLALKENYYTHRKEWLISQKIKLYKNDFFISKILCSTCNAVWNKLYRAEFVKLERFKEGIINEDSLFLYELSKHMNINNYELILPINTYYYRNRDNSYCNRGSFKLRCDTCENLRYFYNEIYTSDKKTSYKIRHVYIKHLYNLLNELYGRKHLFDNFFPHFYSYWREVSNISILRSLKGKNKFVGLFIKYLPKYRMLWLKYRLNKI